MSRWRFRLLVFFVNMCRACEWPRVIFPVAVSRTRLAAPLCVLSFGIVNPLPLSDSKLRISNCGLRILITSTNSHFAIRNSKSLIYRRLSFCGAALMSLWSKDDEHLVSFHPWPCFDLTNVREIQFQFCQDPRTQF